MRCCDNCGVGDCVSVRVQINRTETKNHITAIAVVDLCERCIKTLRYRIESLVSGMCNVRAVMATDNSAEVPRTDDSETGGEHA